MFVVVVYDVDAKRDQRILGILSQYLKHVMLSGFEGEVPPAKIREMLQKVDRVIDESSDSVRVYVFEARKNVAIYTIGRPLEDVTPII